MIIYASEKLEPEVIMGEYKIVYIPIDSSTDEEGNMSYRYKEVRFNIFDTNSTIKLRVEKVKKNLYAELRQAEYPPMEDFIDATVKGNTQELEEYIQKCLIVKQKYPKGN